MYRNPNFTWMQSYTEPDIPFDFLKDLYWMYMYMKIRGQGTQEDVHRLAELYDESRTGTVSAPVGWFSLDFNAWFHHRYAVTKFISEQRALSHDDECTRRQRAQVAELKRRETERPDMEFGIDWTALRREFELMQAELDAEGAGDPVRTTPVYVDGPYGRVAGVPFSGDLKRRGRLIKTMDVDLGDAPVLGPDGRFVGLTRAVTHVEIYDRFQDTWTALLHTNICPNTLPSGKPAYSVIGCTTLVNPVSRCAGMIHLLRKGLRGELRCAQDGDWETQGFDDAKLLAYYQRKGAELREQGRAKAKSTRRRTKAVDISKVQRALGVVDGNCGDDLDGDIF